MAVLYKFNYEGNEILVPFIFNDVLYNGIATQQETFNNIADVPGFFDGVLDGDSSWQLIRLPIRSSIIDEKFAIVFPNMFISNTSAPEYNTESFILYDDDKIEIPSTYISGAKSPSNDEQTFCVTNNKYQHNTEYTGVNWGFPSFGLREGSSADDRKIYQLEIRFPLLPNRALLENGIDVKVPVKAILLNLSIDESGLFPKYKAMVVTIASSPELIPTESIVNYWLNKKPIIYDDDPFNPGGESGTGGGGGSFDNTSTPIEIPGLPSISAASTGFISLYNPTLGQLNQLSSYLWSDLFEIDGWKKLFADPMDAILGLSILPVAIPGGGVREVKVGNIGTGISLTVASTQFVEVDCGSINVNEYWGAYLDYEPYTQAQIFLPYIGTRPISVDEIMGKTVRVVYHVDILTGACCCFVKCGDSVLYTYNGQCSIPIPITGANYTSVVNGVISVAASVGSLVATGGASAPTAIPAIASSAINQMKPSIEKSGSISGSAGVLNMQIPYLILIRPRQALPSKQNEFIGYPSLITVQLTELSGYTEVQSIHLENIPATQEELSEIQSLLEGGVIF